jgi:hypothetical protein
MMATRERSSKSNVMQQFGAKIHSIADRGLICKFFGDALHYFQSAFPE